MQKSVLVEILRSLNRKEVRDLQKWLQSPAHNQRSDVIQLFDFLVENSSREKALPEKGQELKAIFFFFFYDDKDGNPCYTEYLSQKLNLNYNYLSNLFSEITGNTLEKYIISRKIDRVKELLVYENLNVSEIAFRLNYSSVAHLSAQFKKVTGLTPTHFKRIRLSRKPLPV